MNSAPLAIGSLRFGEPLYLWLLCAPGVLLLLWTWRVARRRADAHGYLVSRLLPVEERFNLVGELSFWLCLIVALTLCIVALARPQGLVSLVRKSGVDIVVLQDGSSSMRVKDVRPDRWQRSMEWVRTLSGALSWEGDRMALATFANIAMPQIRLTRDPNTIFFFLDHLSKEPTFRLKDDTSWDTNVEDAIYWGLKLVDKDEATFGRNRNAKAFIVISDGQVWSGEVNRSIALASRHRIVVHVIGVGTSAGGLIPAAEDDFGKVRAEYSGLSSTVDRRSLAEIARAGGGQYFELGTQPDRDIALKIIDDTRRRSDRKQNEESVEELYWFVLLGAAAFIGIGLLFLKQRVQLVLQVIGAVLVLAMIASVSR